MLFRSKIASVVWNTGGWNTSGVYSNQIYGYERGTNVISNPSDGITRTTSWTGKVALMYPSDYGYATDFNNCSESLFHYDYDGCYDNDWLSYEIGKAHMFLSPSSDYAYKRYGITNGYAGVIAAVELREVVGEVMPVFYLNSELGIVSGNGSEGNPYVVR